MNTGLHVIFGTGAIGLATLDALSHRGRTVGLVNRSGKAPVPEDVEVVAGDADVSGRFFAQRKPRRSSNASYDQGSAAQL